MKVTDVYLPVIEPAVTGYMLKRSLPDYPFPNVTNCLFSAEVVTQRAGIQFLD